MSQDRSSDEDKKNQILAKAWSDPAFKQRFMKDPKGVSAEFGLTVPDGMELRVVENTPEVFYIVLPGKPTDELSDEQLTGVAGGVYALPGTEILQPTTLQPLPGSMLPLRSISSW